MIRAALPLLLLLFVLPSVAQAGTTLSLERRDCARLVRHVPDAGVAYKPGVDAHGRKVAPADLGDGNAVALPDRFEFPVTVDLGDRLGIPVGGDADYIARMPVGIVSVGVDGRVAFNGVPLTDDEAAELAARCQDTGAGR